MTELILLDLYGTLVKADISSTEIRRGFKDFFDYYNSRNLNFSIVTDASLIDVRETFEICPFLSKVGPVYDQRYLTDFAGQILKDLDRICNEFRVHCSQALMIGDDYQERDSCSAHYAGISFIQVPQFRENSPTAEEIKRNGESIIYENPGKPFSFIELIGRIK